MKIKLTKKQNSARLLDDIAAIKYRFNKNVMDDKRQVIVMMLGGKENNQVVCSTNMMYKTLLKRNATAEEICKEMKQA